jgi:hypothetical protein
MLVSTFFAADAAVVDDRDEDQEEDVEQQHTSRCLVHHSLITKRNDTSNYTLIILC